MFSKLISKKRAKEGGVLLPWTQAFVPLPSGGSVAVLQSAAPASSAGNITVEAAPQPQLQDKCQAGGGGRAAALADCILLVLLRVML